jgi:von Willebrand factor A domain-containing protein 8
LQSLSEAGLSEKEWEMYKRLRGSVEGEVAALRNVLEALTAREKEREWLKGRAEGEVDEARLVEALAGDKLRGGGGVVL